MRVESGVLIFYNAIESFLGRSRSQVNFVLAIENIVKTVY